MFGDKKNATFDPTLDIYIVIPPEVNGAWSAYVGGSSHTEPQPGVWMSRAQYDRGLKQMMVW